MPPRRAREQELQLRQWRNRPSGSLETFDIASVFHLNFILLVISSETASWAACEGTETNGGLESRKEVSEAETKMMEREMRGVERMKVRREVEKKREEERIKHKYWDITAIN